MKVFNVNDYEWYAGENLEEVEAFIKKEHGYDEDELEIIELEETDLAKLKFYTGEDEPEENFITFQERLDHLIEDREIFPCFFATTEW